MAMDFSSGEKLVSSIAEYMDRPELLDENVIPAWVKMAEKQIGRSLRASKMVDRSTATVVSGTEYVSLPGEYQEMKSVHVLSPTPYAKVLRLASLDDLQDLNVRFPNGGYPEAYAIVGTSIEIAPKPNVDIVVEIVSYGHIPALDVTTPSASTWLLEDAPDIYFYTVLALGFGFMMEDQKSQMFAGMASNAVASLNEASIRAEKKGSRMVRKIQTFG